MGAEVHGLTFKNCASKEELFKQWKEAQETARYDRGHDPYSGRINLCDLSVSRLTFDTEKAARDYAYGNDPAEKREAIAFAYGQGQPLFPVSAADKALVLKEQSLTTEFNFFEYEVLARFLAAKSSSKSCDHCDSKITQKGMRPKLVSRPRFLDLLNHQSNSREGMYLKQDLVNCPVCGRNLLMTNTDVERHKSLEARLKKAQADLADARKSFQAKAKPFGYYVYAVAPS